MAAVYSLHQNVSASKCDNQFQSNFHLYSKSNQYEIKYNNKNNKPLIKKWSKLQEVWVQLEKEHRTDLAMLNDRGEQPKVLARH